MPKIGPAPETLPPQEAALAQPFSDELTPLTVERLKLMDRALKTLLKSTLREEVHFFTIKGDPKKRKMLVDAGAAKIALLLRLTPRTEIEDLSTSDRRFYRAHITICARSGLPIADAWGSASSDEEIHRWKAALCQEQYDEVAEDHRREAWKDDWKRAAPRGVETFQSIRHPDRVCWKVLQVRTEPMELDNTILKKAITRGFRTAVVRASASGDLFAEEPNGQDTVEQKAPPPRQSSGAVRRPERKAPPPSGLKGPKAQAFWNTLLEGTGGDVTKAAIYLKKFTNEKVTKPENLTEGLAEIGIGLMTKHIEEGGAFL